jgi:quercetin dioxygenase-like cupin family protein
MKNILFQIPVYQYSVLAWAEKKKRLVSLLNDEKFKYHDTFLSDRSQNSNEYLKDFVDIIQSELENFRLDLGLDTIFVTDVWTVKYKTGDFHAPHTHSSSGYSGVLYLDYDQEEHSGTCFVNSITNPITDLTDGARPQVREGDILLTPSNVLHFTYPNKSTKDRTIMGFDIKFKP